MQTWQKRLQPSAIDICSAKNQEEDFSYALHLFLIIKRLAEVQIIAQQVAQPSETEHPKKKGGE